MKRHGKHGQRFGDKQSARLFARGLGHFGARHSDRVKRAVYSDCNDYAFARLEQIRGWVAQFGLAWTRSRVVEIYGPDYAAIIPFLDLEDAE